MKKTRKTTKRRRETLDEIRSRLEMVGVPSDIDLDDDSAYDEIMARMESLGLTPDIDRN